MDDATCYRLADRPTQANCNDVVALDLAAVAKIRAFASRSYVARGLEACLSTLESAWKRLRERGLSRTADRNVFIGLSTR